jgi:hypothetical protein
MSLPPHTTLSPTDRSRLLTKSSKPCCNALSTNIRPTGIICCFQHYGIIAQQSKPTGFTLFHLIHGIEATLPIECEIPTLRTAIKLLPDTAPMEQCLLNLESLDEDRRSSLQNNEAAKKQSKATFDRHVNLRSFNEGDLILAYDIAHDTLGHGKFKSLWHGPYIIQHCLTKGAYILASPEGYPLKEPINGLYLKKFYA